MQNSPMKLMPFMLPSEQESQQCTLYPDKYPFIGK